MWKKLDREYLYCTKDYYHCTRTQEKLFQKGYRYEHFYKRIDWKYYMYVCKQVKHFKYPRLQREDLNRYEYWVYFTQEEVWDYFVFYDSNIHKR